ncbi:GrpB family protein [candidate division WOR-3 bacterium]|nr:GrpB family protein [candidate division WOR-3 bacterium]
MIIQKYDKKWPYQFEQIRIEIQEYVKSNHRMYHVGSTSIPGMYAKPVIDIDMEIDDVQSFDAVKRELEMIGYNHNGDQGIEGREAFKRKGGACNEILDSIRHHLYVCVKGARELTRHILFRDYLIKHVEYVEKYNLIKMQILKNFCDDNLEKYVDVKENEYKWFFEDVIRKSAEENGTQVIYKIQTCAKHQQKP